MELLGTKNGSTPGPTAAKAEAAYNAQVAAQKEKVGAVCISSLFPAVGGSGLMLNTLSSYAPGLSSSLQTVRSAVRRMVNILFLFHSYVFRITKLLQRRRRNPHPSRRLPQERSQTRSTL